MVVALKNDITNSRNQKQTQEKQQQQQQQQQQQRMLPATTELCFYFAIIVLATAFLLFADIGMVSTTTSPLLQNYSSSFSSLLDSSTSSSLSRHHDDSNTNKTSSIRHNNNVSHTRQILKLIPPKEAAGNSSKIVNINTTNATTLATLQKHQPLPPRILYIVTSGGEPRMNSDYPKRFREKVTPIIVSSVKSLLKNNFCMVDVYLIISYPLDPSLDAQLRQALPDGVGLEVWSDATPYGINCKFNSKDECMVHKKGQKRKYGPKAISTVQLGGAQLARQHRYVIKDKLPYYDFFCVFEDDMLIKQSHVKQHMKWMRYVRTLKSQAAKMKYPKESPKGDWRKPLSFEQLMRFRPGFIRVEVMQPDHKRPINDVSTFPIDNVAIDLDPTICCSMNDDDDEIKNKRGGVGGDLMVWETTLLGQGVRTLEPLPKKDDTNSKYNATETTWVSLLAIQPHWSSPASLWAGDIMTPKPQYRRQEYSGAKNLAQSAGWMASRREILELDTLLCSGGFIPPLSTKEYHDDGYDSTNVEFWSGGIQMWSKKCSIQRFIPLAEFDHHLLYHSSNNKQNKITSERQILVKNMIGDLLAVQQHAEERLDWNQV